jgi:hypothetical protein
MTALVTADEKGRLLIRGTRRGRQYVVKEEDGGWWVVPVAETYAPKPRNRREWAGSKKSLGEHLQALADAGLRIERAEIAKQPVPPCRF